MIESQIVRHKGASDNPICKSISGRNAGLARWAMHVVDALSFDP